MSETPRPRRGRPALNKVPLEIRLPLDIRARLDLLLVSETEGRVPQGAYSELFEHLARQYLDWAGLDLTPFQFPPGFFVRGPKEMIEALRARLERGGNDVQS